VDRDLIPKSPFRHLVSASIASDKMHYVPLSVALDFLDRCEPLRWRVLFGLTRLEGLRAPSETHVLTFRDVDWDRNELTVNSAKLARFLGKSRRTVPASPVMMALLREARALASDDRQPIVTVPENNRDREFKRQLKNLGISPWPRAFQNLRASCEIQWLMEGHPEFAVSQWIGHSVTVSRKHYANIVPEEDYALFHGRGSVITSRSAENSGAQKVAHTPAELDGNVSQLEVRNNQTNRVSDLDATLCERMRMSALGVEPRTYGLKVGTHSRKSPGKSRDLQSGSAKSSALATDPELALLAEAWPRLPEAVQAAILHLAQLTSFNS
jgi:hypothetical protein